MIKTIKKASMRDGTGGTAYLIMYNDLFYIKILNKNTNYEVRTRMAKSTKDEKKAKKLFQKFIDDVKKNTPKGMAPADCGRLIFSGHGVGRSI
jgi:hypothetical protein